MNNSGVEMATDAAGDADIAVVNGPLESEANPSATDSVIANRVTVELSLLMCILPLVTNDNGQKDIGF